MTDKIQDMEALAQILEQERSRGRKIVHCHGVFDLVHIGHIRHFNVAKDMGDILVVSLTEDVNVNKGPDRPVFKQDLRAEVLAALDCVDYVAINKWPTAVKTIELLKPHIYVKGSEYQQAQDDVTGGIQLEEAAVRAVGGEIAFTDDIVFSSSTLINKHMPVLPEDVREYLSGFSRRHATADILGYLESARALRVLVVGETIIDEYQYCEQIGKSAKEPVLAVKYLSTEKYPGGVLAIANHVANFCDHVGLLTFLGEKGEDEKFVRESLSDNVKTMFSYKEDSPTIVKRRFVENYLLQKLFEVYEMNGDELGKEQGMAVCAKLEEIMPEYDVVIVADYGHGMMTPDVIDVLCDKAPFLAINTQSNAGNKGLSTISKYPRADFVSLAGHEILLEERASDRDFKRMILNVSRKLECENVLVTQGKVGNQIYNKSEGYFEVPAFGGQVVDRMGAGDAVLSLASLCVAQGAPMEVVAFIANVVGAQAITMMGHESFIQPVPLIKHITTLLK